MRIDGLWLPDETGALCPTVFGFVVTPDREYPMQFLIDTGSAQTVLGADFASALVPYQQPATGAQLTSAGGTVKSFYAATRLYLIDTLGRKVSFSLNCAVLTDPMQADTHLLGRDILDYFTLVCDREAEVVALLRPPHTYAILG